MKEEPDTMEPNAEEQADPFNLAYDMLKDRDREIRELQATIAALRSQIVEWREGGSSGAAMPDFEGRETVLFAVRRGHVVKCRSLKHGRFTSGDGYFDWQDIEWYCLLADFPLPVVPRT